MVTIKKPKGILIISPFFAPNIGGVETHLTDLTHQLNLHQIPNYTLTYSPLTSNIKAPFYQKDGYTQIIRFPWLGHNIFHWAENFPIFDFLYLTPYLFFASLFWLLFNHQKISTIHSHGINGAFIGHFLSKIFGKAHLISTHAIYENISGISQNISVYLFNKSTATLCLSQGSRNQLISWGVSAHKLSLYHYWIDLENFYPAATPPQKFTILYSGRLISKKGVKLLARLTSQFPQINFIFAGNGPLAYYLTQRQKTQKNLSFFGPVSYDQQPAVYRQASILCIPSLYTEGFGRSAIEAVASGLPIIGSNIGSISEAVGKDVSILVKPTIANLKNAIKSLYIDKNKYTKMRLECRPYAKTYYSAKNFDEILENYR